MLPTSASARDAPAARTGRVSVAPTAAILAVLLVVSVFLAIGLGAATIAPGDVARYLWAAVSGGSVAADEANRYQIVWLIRVPRVLLAAVVGAGLAAVGVAVQALVRNALADPFVLGVSSGAAVGAVSVSVLGALSVLGIYAVSAGAFAGALAATMAVFAVAWAPTGVTPLRLVLTGVALSFGFQALTGMLIYFVPSSEATSTMLFWTMGSFGAATWGTLPAVATAVLLGTVTLWSMSSQLDVIALGDESAMTMGVEPAGLRRQLFLLTALMTGAMVAASGTIAFVGLVIPHITRMVVGARHVRVLIVAPLLGGALMVWVDLLSRTLVAPRELPIGVLTAVVGVPVFIWLIRRRRYVFGAAS